MQRLLLSLGIFVTAAAPVPVLADRLPLPLVQPGPPAIPGAVQPVAPGARPGSRLPRLSLNPPIPEVRRVEYASNGFIEVAHALVLVTPGDVTLKRDLVLAQEAVKRAFGARPGLDEVDVSVYTASGFQGLGGPLPLLTASVPRDRLAAFAALTPVTVPGFERAWVNPSPLGATRPPTRPPLRAPEKAPVFIGGAAGLADQQVKQLASQLNGGPRGSLFFHGDPGRALAAFTFDDAPHPLFEPLLLDLLRRANVKATFFCIGRNAEAYPYFVRDMAREGHEVANHTYHHVRLPGLPDAEVRDELARTNAVLTGITGAPVRYFRPPGGEYSARTLQIASSLGLTTTFWTDDPGDFDNPGNAVIEGRLVRKLRRGGIVLLHDNVLETIEVLPAFLRLAQTRGVQLTTAGRLAAEAQR